MQMKSFCHIEIEIELCGSFSEHTQPNQFDQFFFQFTLVSIQ